MTTSDKAPEKRIYMSQSGLPLSFQLEWPFHKSMSGADFWVLHADIALENSLGLHAPVSVNLSATVYEVMPSLEPKDIEAPVINALRKEVDRKQIEFLKSRKGCASPVFQPLLRFQTQQVGIRKGRRRGHFPADRAEGLLANQSRRRAGLGRGSHRSALPRILYRAPSRVGAEAAQSGVDRRSRANGLPPTPP